MCKKYLLLICYFILNFNLGFAQITVFYGTTPMASVATLLEAKNYVRTINQNMTNDITINISGGTYLLNNTLVFNPSDSGTNNYKIIYKAADFNNKPKISSAKLVTQLSQLGWVFDTALNLWKIDIGSNYSRQIYKDGVKVVRARMPNPDAVNPFYINNPSNNYYNLLESDNGFFSLCNIDNFFSLPRNQVAQRDIEIVSINEWRSNRIPIKSVCGQQLFVDKTFWDKTIRTGQFYCGNKVAWIENAKEFIDMPDEWYIDRSSNPNYLFYKTESSNVAPSKILIPTLETFISGTDVKNITFNGLIFEYSNWTGPSDFDLNKNSNLGLGVIQTDWQVDISGKAKFIHSPIDFIDSNNITFKNNIFQHIGFTSILFRERCNNNTICNNVFTDICASAISIGHPEHVAWEKPKEEDNNLIKNNLIEKVANEYHSGVGVFISSANNSIISHNEINDSPTGAICIGYDWKSTLKYSTGSNRVEFNKINCSKQFMPDTAAIYTLGHQGQLTNISGNFIRTTVFKNYIYNQKLRYGAIYLDQGSSYIDVDSNVIELNNETQNFPAASFVNWRTYSSYDASQITFKNNYYSQQYPSSINAPALCCGSATSNFLTINENNNQVLTSPIQINALTIKNNSGRSSTQTCQ